VLLTLVLGNRATPLERGPQLGRADAHPEVGLVLGRRRAAQTVAAAAMSAVVALLAAGAIVDVLPDLGRADGGATAGPGVVAQTHPGLAGGLDTGLPVQLSEEVVLRGQTDRPLYWRGTTYDQWDGRRWGRDVDSASVLVSASGVDLGAAVPPAQELAGPEAAGVVVGDLPDPVVVHQELRAEQAGFDVLVGGWQMTSLAVGSGEYLAEVGADSSVVLSEALPAGATWTVESTLIPAGEDELRQADPALLAPSSPVVERYGTEDAITPPVAELARSITAGAPTTYDKIRALEDWFAANLTYTRDIAPLPLGIDAVHHLLFESRRGFCEQIGSALVVMLRSLGIPARLVVGFVPGELDSATGEWVSRGSDAHAWAEVYFPGIGWQGFDPTAGVPLSAEPIAGGEGSVAWTLAAALAAVVVAAVAAVAGVRLRRRRATAAGGPPALVELQRRFDTCGRRMGRRWTDSMTVREKGDDLVSAGAAAEPVDRAVGSIERLTFFELDQAPMTDLDLSAVGTDVEGLESALAGVERPRRRAARSMVAASRSPDHRPGGSARR
jgi:hypothetical protein